MVAVRSPPASFLPQKKDIVPRKQNPRMVRKAPHLLKLFSHNYAHTTDEFHFLSSAWHIWAKAQQPDAELAH